ncbi:MAG TPA: SpoIID/LytB domain-containing protein [Candidatus Nanopelagicales bacterium]|nr:SpoIID/LytB domain-containing protein [Candidatus Nanopelagicales bacterium]
MLDVQVVRRLAASAAAAASALAVVALAPAAPVSAVTTVPVPTSFSFTGSGWGHGVGMSQYGARGMALEGSTATQIAQHYYTGSTVAPYSDSVNLRVNLLHQRTVAVFRSEAVRTGGGGIEVTLTGRTPIVGDAKDLWSVVAANGAVTLRRVRAGVTTLIGTGRYVVVHWGGTTTAGGAGTGPTVLNLATSTAGLTTAGHRYRYGWLDFGTTAAAPTTFEAVANVRLHDEYLMGISEMSSSWPAAALQAQVLASRSYALARYGTGTIRSACRCHVDSGKGPYYDQTYAGFVKETSTGGSLWRAAVIATLSSSRSGLTVVSGGKPVTAFYFSASGGRTQSSADVWGGTLAYAQSVDDHWSMDPSVPWSRWIPRVRTQAQLAAAFGLPNVVSLDLTSRTAGGGIKRAVAISSTGATAALSGETFRSRLSLPSTWVSGATDPTTGAVLAKVPA